MIAHPDKAKLTIHIYAAEQNVTARTAAVRRCCASGEGCQRLPSQNNPQYPAVNHHRNVIAKVDEDALQR